MLGNMHGWEFIVWGVAAWVAIAALVRLMNHRRELLTRELLAEAEAEHRARQAEENSLAPPPDKKRKPA
jgi:hypothetical protein